MYVLYRTSVSEKRPGIRPNFFSKIYCLKSLTTALEKLEDYEFCLIYDGEIASQQTKEIVNWAAQYGVVDNVNFHNNSKTFRYVYDKAIVLEVDKPVYLVEDDYLHTPDSLIKLSVAMKELDADYFTLYDHPVRYAKEYKFGLDLPSVNGTRIWIAGDHHWRTQESTCMTFAARVKTLREDKKIFWHHSEKIVPDDRDLFRHLQGLIGYEEESPQRLLVGPIPSLSTHCHLPWLAPCVDWQKVVKMVI